MHPVRGGQFHQSALGRSYIAYWRGSKSKLLAAFTFRPPFGSGLLALMPDPAGISQIKALTP